MLAHTERQQPLPQTGGTDLGFLSHGRPVEGKGHLPPPRDLQLQSRVGVKKHGLDLPLDLAIPFGGVLCVELLQGDSLAMEEAEPCNSLLLGLSEALGPGLVQALHSVHQIICGPIIGLPLFLGVGARVRIAAGGVGSAAGGVGLDPEATLMGVGQTPALLRGDWT